MKVSVCITTYNHERYIAQAIESALMQVVDFPYEILIGEDESSDGTRDIVLAYQRKYPERIRLFLHDHPPGYVHVNGRQNFINNLANATGQYIALLEGDDYWTCPSKLQKQVEYLDKNPGYAICFHNAKEIYENGEREPWDYCPPGMKETLTLRDLLACNFMPTCSVVFRRGLFHEFPDWYSHLRFGDWPLHILNAERGDIRYINELMGVHRHHPGGIWSSVGPAQDTEETLRFYTTISSYLGSRYHGRYADIINPELSKLCYEKAMNDCFRKNYASARRYLLRGLLCKPLSKQLLSLALLRTFGRSFLNSQWVNGNRVELPD